MHRRLSAVAAAVMVTAFAAILLPRAAAADAGNPASPSAVPADCNPKHLIHHHHGDHGMDPHSHHEGEEGHAKHSYSVASVNFERVQVPFIIALWIFLATLAKIGFHMANKLSSIFPESCLLIVVGVIIGLLLFYTNLTTVSPLTPDTFFLFMLPPIVLDAGYFMPNRLFFDNLGTILLFAVIGTVWNTCTIGLSLWAVGLTGLYSVDLSILEAFLFSALISAVDPVAVLAVFEEIHVNEVLYIVVFGESLLNDAVTVVLYHMFETYTEMGQENIKVSDILSGFASFFVVAIGGTSIGVIWGYLTAFVTRFTNHVRVIEPVFVFVMSYMSYLNAEMFHLSGILAITFCGISMKNYVEANISQKSHTTVKYAMKMISSSSETIIFMFLGVATVNDDHNWNTWFVVFTILFCTVYRAIGVVVLTAIANHWRVHKLNKVEEFVMAYGGLRGAVAFALALTISESVIEHKHMFITTTIAVVYFTVFIQGITIKPLVAILGVKRSEKRRLTMNERIHERFMDHLMAGIEDIVGHHGNYHLRDKFKYYDNKYIRRLLVRDHKTGDPKILETFSKLNLKDAMNIVHQSGVLLPRIGTTELSLAALFRNYTNTNLGSRHINRKTNTNLLTVPSDESQGSFPRNDSSVWNLDMQELEYSPSGKDLNDARLHHILSDAMFKPVRRHRKYSRSQIHEPEIHPPFHHKMRMQIRHVLSEQQNKHRKMKAKKNGHLHKNANITTPMQNGTTKPPSYNVIYPEDEDGITFAAAPGRDDGPITFTARGGIRGANQSPLVSPLKPRPNHLSFKGMGLNKSVSQHTIPSRPPSPPPPQTVTEAQLPWKRDAVSGDDLGEPLRQQEFPPWIENKEYIAYMSPTSTFLGGLDTLAVSRPPVFNIFEQLEELSEDRSSHASFDLESEATVIEVEDPVTGSDVEDTVRAATLGTSLSSTQPQALTSEVILSPDARNQDDVVTTL